MRVRTSLSIPGSAVEDRARVLLRAAYDLLTQCERSYYVLDTSGVRTHYDGTDCDGICLRADIADELGIEPETDPLSPEAP